MGVSGLATITVSGTLTLDGVTTTHASGAGGRGINVNTGGTLILDSGAVSGNTVSSGSVGGGGIYNNGGSLTINGGTIANNSTAVHHGGGVLNSNGIFVMSGGTIEGNHDNASGSDGGGVMNVGTASFTMTSGTIRDNEAVNGGGVFNSGASASFIVKGSDALIFGNTANNGGGVYNSGGTFIMVDGTISENTANATAGGVRNNGTTAKFTMSGGKISDNTVNSGPGGGVTNSNSAIFTLSSGEISENTSSISSGGGVNNQGSTFVMTGGEIFGNGAVAGGGVLSWWGAAFTMEGGRISDNKTTAATGRGGGIYNYYDATFTMKGGTITGHTTTSYGGGIYNWGESGGIASIIIEDGVITGNNASIDGGGIYSTGDTFDVALVDIRSGAITSNSASNDGGGVWAEDLRSLTVGADALFSNNHAAAAYDRNPADDALYMARILGTQWTLPLTQGYNNFDINYRNGEQILFTVAYDSNGSTSGDVPVDGTSYNPNDLVTVAGKGDLARSGYTFVGWSLSNTATVAEYQEGDTFEIAENVNLYAVWQADSPVPPVSPVPTPEPSPDNPTPVAILKGSLPNTGDSFSIVNGIGMVLLGATAFALLLIAVRKIRQ